MITLLIWFLGTVIALTGAMFGKNPVLVIGLLVIVAAPAFHVACCRCPHCGKYLGKSDGKRCQHCGKKLSVKK